MVTLADQLLDFHSGLLVGIVMGLNGEGVRRGVPGLRGDRGWLLAPGVLMATNAFVLCENTCQIFAIRRCAVEPYRHSSTLAYLDIFGNYEEIARIAWAQHLCDMAQYDGVEPESVLETVRPILRRPDGGEIDWFAEPLQVPIADRRDGSIGYIRYG